MAKYGLVLAETRPKGLQGIRRTSQIILLFKGDLRDSTSRFRGDLVQTCFSAFSMTM